MKIKENLKKIDKKKLKIWVIVIAIVVVYVAASVTAMLLIRNKKGGLDVGVVVYGLSETSSIDGSFLNDSEASAPTPYMLSNGKNNSVYYNAPLLDTGLVTEAAKNEAESNVPAMVVGEGTSRENTTIVRILNEQQACITQFLAFSSEVYGGVNVAAGRTVIDGKEVTLIATAAGGAYCDAARKVRVFDCNGMIYMEITPRFYKNAPFAIATGNFVGNDKKEYLLVSSGYVEKGKIEANIYSLADGTIVKKIKYEVGKEHDGKQVLINTRNNANGTDSLIIFVKGDALYKKKADEKYPKYTDAHAVFEAQVSGSVAKADINIPTDAENVFSSANDGEKYLVTSSGEIYEEYNSYYYSYIENDKDGKLVRLDMHESGFYWNADKEYLDLNTITAEDEEYIRYAEKAELSIDANGDLTGLDNGTVMKTAYWKVNLAKYNLLPIKSAYRKLAAAYKANPESVVAIELFSDEIFADLTEGLSLPAPTVDGSVEINDDEKELMYKMAVRMSRLYSEALLAGIPPEALTSDLLYDDVFKDEAVVKKAYVSDSCLYNIGAPFGTHTSGIWYTDGASALVLAKKSGYKNNTVASYSSQTSDYDMAFYQLLYMLRNGCRYVGLESENREYMAAELSALQLLNDTYEARYSYANKSYSAVPVEYNGKCYNVVCLGGSTSNGMLKSVNSDGSHDGNVYNVPFHTKVDVQNISLKDNPRCEKTLRKFKKVNAGSQIELTFGGRYNGKGAASVKIKIYSGEKLIESACTEYRITSDKEYYRYVFSSQYDIDELTVEIDYECENYSKCKISDISLTHQQTDIANPDLLKYDGTSAFGGVSVDILDRDAVYNK